MSSGSQALCQYQRYINTTTCAVTDCNSTDGKTTGMCKCIYKYTSPSYVYSDLVMMSLQGHSTTQMSGQAN